MLNNCRVEAHDSSMKTMAEEDSLYSLYSSGSCYTTDHTSTSGLVCVPNTWSIRPTVNYVINLNKG